MLAIVFIIALLVVSSPASSSAIPQAHERRWSRPVVTIDNGPISGIHLESFDQDVFLGIPFAVPPTGENGLRFSNPVAYSESFPGTGHDGSAYSYSCPQYGPFAVGVGAPANQSEDCLTLNVVRPSGSFDENLPVLVWIYGGGYTAGATSDPVYNLSYIVQESANMGKPIIAVSMNYRTAIFGFIASQEVVDSGNSNLGLKDQRLALHWVKKHIGAFGGDCNKITIWGESAGAYSVGLQVLAYGGKQSGLFRGAIYESGTALATYQDIDHYQPLYDAIVNATDCSSSPNTLQCLRTLPYETIYNVSATYGFTPIIDGDFIPDWPSNLLETGQFDTDVANLIGANTDEGSATFFGWSGLNTDNEMISFLSNSTVTGLNISSGLAAQLVTAYSSDSLDGVPFGFVNEGINLTALGQLYRKSASIAGDLFIIAPRRYQCEVASYRGAKVYSYRFDQTPYIVPGFILGSLPLNPTHYSEISFVFGNPENLTDPYESYLGPSSNGNQALSSKMMRSWISFVAELDPNHDTLGETWPDYGYGPINMVFRDDGCYTEADDFRAIGIKLLNDHPKELLH
ncbi:Alpha/Beta hydrolase protein [Naematelia encephala]|uniref:Carboxylic ester hydrolase n=1 Tax=Naematelia encephala TaxID=71784 RepID=A0A1Y2B8A6_9TREE|nr:Alpha/Beta hydrolase protein [Naematelia encephala]